MKSPEPTKSPELKAVMGEQKRPAADDREKVLIVNRYGAEATPYKTDLQSWLDDEEQGWKVKKVASDNSTNGVK